MKRAQVTVPLDIPEVRVLQPEINKVGELIITIESTKEGTICCRCGREIRKRHGYDEWTIIIGPLWYIWAGLILRKATYRMDRNECFEAGWRTCLNDTYYVNFLHLAYIK